MQNRPRIVCGLPRVINNIINQSDISHRKRTNRCFRRVLLAKVAKLGKIVRNFKKKMIRINHKGKEMRRLEILKYLRPFLECVWSNLTVNFRIRTRINRLKSKNKKIREMKTNIKIKGKIMEKIMEMKNKNKMKINLEGINSILTSSMIEFFELFILFDFWHRMYLCYLSI